MGKEYPMTYEEFEKRVRELFLTEANSPAESRDRKTFLGKETDVIKGEYNSACHYYDNPRSPNTQFTDEGLIHQPVRILNMIY